MGVIEIEKLTAPLPGDAAGGVDVEYDAQYLELEKAAQGTPESVMGDEVKPGEEPDWRQVKAGSLALFDRTRDLRVAMLLTTALLKQDGLAGFHEGLAVVRGFIENLWEHFYPKLDPSDNNDPALRVNILRGFDGDGLATDVYKFKQRLREATLTNSRQKIGKFSFRDLQMAKGEIPPPEAKPGAGEAAPKPPDEALIQAAFEDTSTEDLQATGGLIQAAIDDFAAMDAALGQKIAAGAGPDLSGIKEVLSQLKVVVDGQLARRGVGEPAAAPSGGEAGAGNAAPRGGGGGAWTGGIASRADVVRALDMICEYYDRYEPASPVPVFMKRAKRLVTMNFVDLIRDLAPEAMARIEVFTGAEAPAETPPAAQ